jgi:DNA-binding response OmpR family regulator
VSSRIRNNQKNKGVKILLISGNIDLKDTNRVKESGADDFLQKPFSVKELKEKMTHLFGWNRREEDK